MPNVFVITHPEVTFDATKPVSDWLLSGVGHQRLHALAGLTWVSRLGQIHSSTEPKAIATAEVLGRASNLQIRTHAALREIDRTATGVLPPDQYSEVTDLFFAEPQKSVLGWEPAADALIRIVRAVNAIVRLAATDTDIAIVTHGGVATLLRCYYDERDIARSMDQPGQGHYLVFDRATLKSVTGWLRFEDEWLPPANQNSTLMSAERRFYFVIESERRACDMTVRINVTNKPGEFPLKWGLFDIADDVKAWVTDYGTRFLDRYAENHPELGLEAVITNLKHYPDYQNDYWRAFLYAVERALYDLKLPCLGIRASPTEDDLN